MGYYSRYSLRVLERPEEEHTQIIAGLRDEVQGAQWAFQADGSANEEIKWYEWRSDLDKFTHAHPNLLLEVTRVGEDHGDFERCYFRGGAHVSCKGTVAFEVPDLRPLPKEKR